MKIFYIFLLFFMVACERSISIDEYKVYGDREFYAEKWERSPKKIRAEMIYSYLLKNKPLRKLTMGRVKKDLGESDVYFVQDFFPAYSVIHKDEEYVFAFSMSGACGDCTVKNVYIEKVKNAKK